MVRGRRFASMILFVVCAGLALGMGGLTGEDVPTRIPTPEQNFVATVVDQADVRTRVTLLSIEGYTVFVGKMGKGQLAVPFAEVKRADFRMSGDALEALLHLKTGKDLVLSVDRRKECYGKTEFGNYRIALGDIKMLTIDSQITPKTP